MYCSIVHYINQLVDGVCVRSLTTPTTNMLLFEALCQDCEQQQQAKGKHKKWRLSDGQHGEREGGGSGPNGNISKADMEKLIEKATQAAPAQTIRIEQAPMVLAPSVPPKKG